MGHVSTPRARVGDQPKRTAAPPDPTWQGTTICSSNATCTAALEQRTVEKSAGVCPNG